MDAASLVPLLLDDLRGVDTVIAPEPTVAQALRTAGLEVLDNALEQAPDGSTHGVVLLSGEVAAAGTHAPGLVAEAVRATRPGGLLALAAQSAVWQSLAG